MSMNSGGGGRGSALNRFVEESKAKRKRQYQKAYDQHEYDGCDPDMVAESA